MDNNAYHEMKEQFFGQLSDEGIRDNIGRAQAIVDDFESSVAWQNVLEDANNWCTKLDAGWQGVYDENELKKLRVLKESYAYIRMLPAVYASELKTAKEELDRRSNSRISIEKDYDNETNYEG